MSWLTLQEMDKATQVQILDETIWISESANILGKGIHPIIFFQAMDK